jgi:hypothetical protein
MIYSVNDHIPTLGNKVIEHVILNIEQISIMFDMLGNQSKELFESWVTMYQALAFWFSSD